MLKEVQVYMAYTPGVRHVNNFGDLLRYMTPRARLVNVTRTFSGSSCTPRARLVHATWSFLCIG